MCVQEGIQQARLMREAEERCHGDSGQPGDGCGAAAGDSQDRKVTCTGDTGLLSEGAMLLSHLAPHHECWVRALAAAVLVFCCYIKVQRSLSPPIVQGNLCQLICLT